MMLDFENEIYTRTKNVITAVDSTVKMKGEIEDRPATLPFMYMVQLVNVPYQRTSSFDEPVNHVRTMIELQCFTNGTGKKAKAKVLMAAALNFLCGSEDEGGLGFLLIDNSPITNAVDPDIHRRVARVEGVIGHDKLIYWR